MPQATDTPAPDSWKTTLQQAAGLIVGVELDHPGNTALKTAAKPFLDYVNGLGSDTQ